MYFASMEIRNAQLMQDSRISVKKKKKNWQDSAVDISLLITMITTAHLTAFIYNRLSNAKYFRTVIYQFDTEIFKKNLD